MSTQFAPNDPSKDKQYPPVDPTKVARVEIFPPIGIARVGNSGTTDKGDPDDANPVQWYYAPEVPGRTDVPFGEFRDTQGRIKRQAVRFRVYAYDSAGQLLGEINKSQDYELTWTCHVANKKAAYFLSSGRYRTPRQSTLRNPDIDHVDTEPVDPKVGADPYDKRMEGRSRLIVDPGEQSLKRGQNEPVRLSANFQGSSTSPVKLVLGEMRTDDHGRLVFLGGSGLARSVQEQVAEGLYQPEIISEFDSVDWIDDICDGWVSVSVSHPARPDMSSKITPARKATVCSAPPKFAWGIDSPTSLYDILEDTYNKKAKYSEHAGTDFYKDIWPVLVGTYRLSWTNEKAFQGHGPGGFGNFLPLESKLADKSDSSQALRDHVFERLREPDFRNKDQAHVQLMPRLSGDDGDAIEPGNVPDVSEPIRRFAALTTLQYNRFKAWKDGNFTKGTPFGDGKPAIEDYPLADQTILLSRAMLEQTIGDPLYPGIEMFWIAKLDDTWDTKVTDMRPPFRVNHDKVLPGYLSRGLSLPWQSDFDLCNTHWWPSARPDDVVRSNPRSPFDITTLPRSKWNTGLRDTPEDVTTSFFPGSTDMIKMWTELGFVAKVTLQGTTSPVWVEVERNLPPHYMPAPE